MSETVEDTKRKLQELEQRIRAAKSSLGHKGEIVSDAEKDWNRMVETHAAIRRRRAAISPVKRSTASASTSTSCVIRSSAGWRAWKETSTTAPRAKVAAEIARVLEILAAAESLGRRTRCQQKVAG
jgi:hypothetical protein